MKKRALSVLLGVAVILTGYWYFSPYLVMYEMRSAIQARDAAAFNAHVDYPALRQSLKTQLAAVAIDRIKESDMPASGAQALGRALGRVLVDSLVDAVVRPETIMRAMDRGVIDLRRRSPDDRPEDPPESGERNWTVEREGTDRLIASRSDPNDVDGRLKVAIVFDRRGFADWKLTELRLLSE